jgi:hypothetical protein
MDELLEFCARMLGDREAGAQTAQAARSDSDGDRVDQLRRAVTACRRVGEPGPEFAAASGDRPTLASAVATELAAATARLPQRQREALALRELLRCTYEDLAKVIGIEPVAAAPLIARARLGLRSALRGPAAPTAACPEHDRALRTIALRQDGEPVLGADDDWLLEHLGHCAGCAQAHAAMLEASVCYRGWRIPQAVSVPAAAFDGAGAVAHPAP